MTQQPCRWRAGKYVTLALLPAPSDSRPTRRGHSTSPLTNEPLAHKHLVPCVALRRCVGEVLEHLAAARRLAL